MNAIQLEPWSMQQDKINAEHIAVMYDMASCQRQSQHP